MANAIQNPESNNLRLMLVLVFKLNMRLKLNKIKRFESKIEWFESDFWQQQNKQTQIKRCKAIVLGQIIFCDDKDKDK